MPYGAITDDEIDAGSPLNAALFSRLARNLEGVLDGDPGAPGVKLDSLEKVAAGDLARYAIPGVLDYIAGNSAQAIDTITFLQEGSFRVTFDYRHTSSNSSVVVSVRLVSDGVTVAQFSSGSTSFQPVSIDIPFNRSRFEVQIFSNLSGPTVQLRDFSIKTAGQFFFPTSDSARWITK